MGGGGGVSEEWSCSRNDPVSLAHPASTPLSPLESSAFSTLASSSLIRARSLRRTVGALLHKQPHRTTSLALPSAALQLRVRVSDEGNDARFVTFACGWRHGVETNARWSLVAWASLASSAPAINWRNHIQAHDVCQLGARSCSRRARGMLPASRCVKNPSPLPRRRPPELGRLPARCLPLNQALKTARDA